MNDELELKLALRPEQVEALLQHPLLRTSGRQTPTPRRLVSTYYDTAAGLLRQRAMALRVRRAGRRRIQTLKVPGDGYTGLQHFQEYEADLRGDRPDLDRIDNRNLQALVRTKRLAEEIAPVFVTDFARRRFQFTVKDSEIELAVDRGEIRAGPHTMPLSEVELELLSGTPARIYEAALVLHEHVPLRLETRTKAERGYALAMACPAVPVKAKRVALDSAMSVGEGFSALARACRDQIRANEALVLAAVDPEGVHQFRVGVRRLRALLRLFRDALARDAYEHLRAELRWLHGELGPAREWDVFLSEMLPTLCHRLPQDRSLEALASITQAARKRAYERAHAAIESARYTSLILRLNLWLMNGAMLASDEGGLRSADLPLSEMAGAALGRRAKRLRRAMKTTPDGDLAALHRVRLEAKKLRYTTEFFHSLYPAKRVKPVLKQLGRIQDELGSLNDSRTAYRLLEEARVHAALNADFGKPLTERAAGIVTGWQAAAIERGITAYAAHRKALRKLQPFWS